MNNNLNNISEQNCCFYSCCSRTRCNDIYCPFKARMTDLYTNSMIPKNLWGLKPLVAQNIVDKKTFAYLNNILQNADKFINNSGNLFLYSKGTGNGKTTWALNIAYSYLRKIWTTTASDACKVLFIHIPTFLSKSKSSLNYNAPEKDKEYIQYILKNCATADIVIWDEIAGKTFTEYEQDQLLILINDRINSGKSNIYTSNIDPTEFESCVGNRLYSRIIYNSKVLPITSGDMRKKVSI